MRAKMTFNVNYNLGAGYCQRETRSPVVCCL